jgi:hypothetical protein
MKGYWNQVMPFTSFQRAFLDQFGGKTVRMEDV